MTLQLLHGDCLELMKTLPDKSIDLFLCDLPYGCLADNRKKKPDVRRADNGKSLPRMNERITGCNWDVPIDLDAFWIQVKRLCKNDHTPILMFCSTKFGNELINSNPDWFRYDLVWNKMRGVSFLSANKMPMRSHEMIYVFSKKGATYYRTDIKGEFKEHRQYGVAKKDSTYGFVNRKTPVIVPVGTITSTADKRCVLSVIDCNVKSARDKHPTQKADDLYEWLITRYSKEGDTILDPTAGSFASCFTAQRLGRNAIGMEMDLGFYEKAKNSVES
jgi:site-specific DNA-methyltransferase (adenine-specific)